MKRLLFLPAIGLIAASVLASPDILPITGTAGTWHYDLQTGEQTPITGLERVLGPAIWASNQKSGHFRPQGWGEWVLDWGDIETPVGLGGFGFAYATNANHGSIDLILCFYRDDNGWNSAGGSYIAAFYLTGLNGTLTPQDRDRHWSWIYRAELLEPSAIYANDLDGDGLGDFSYSYWFDAPALESPDPNPIVGPLIAGDPNAGTAPGIEDWYDLFDEGGYVGTYSFGGDPFAQFYMELFAPACPNRGESGKYCSADIAWPYDCIVGLNDLAQLLGCYGCDADDPNSPCYPDCTRGEGNLSPPPWIPCTPVIDLDDLAELLSQYGDNCNWPQP